MKIHILTGFAGFGLLILLTGCGGSGVSTVEGKVTLDGKALVGATVMFQPKEGNSPSTGVTDANGYYYLQYSLQQNGAEVGQHIVRITNDTTIEDKNGSEIDVPNTVPLKYNEKSTLIKEVKSGSNVINFDLKSK